MTAKAASPKPTAPVGNQQTEVIIGKGAAELLKGVKIFSEVASIINSLPEKAEEYALLIDARATQLVDLDREIKNKIAQQAIELQQAYQREEETLAKEWLAKNNFVAINEDDYDSLEEELKQAKETLESSVKAAEGKAFGIAKADKETALKIAQLEHERKEAANTAKISQLESEAAMYKAQAETFRLQLDEQRKATVQIAEAGKIGQINLGSEAPTRR